ncbi:hypothetical protein LAZ67_18001270 [Cordylochernes scorpioides]|uniref:Uncharacterized protein n=1 Tax=Cordylochernes scorpioides TaxID=51811 RepID=A0ABY6LIE6_9ARAC|nr:hypothetical protein LAZ67_18001259 [Cordylochernes scorpioides]UYV79982.1 hypothetical protein LAZ67_18001270 [Cordylochernes scorpioides]
MTNMSHDCVHQVPGEVPGQAGRQQPHQQDDPTQHRDCHGPQPHLASYRDSCLGLHRVVALLSVKSSPNIFVVCYPPFEVEDLSSTSDISMVVGISRAGVCPQSLVDS